ncbi:hypothetical protein L6164_012801 [Bauhinia variegata]|uniref:Uncharacterized protein n=1 Tax=Bauhinia variegata TaxID=167791 RepID=A0ACB9PBG8_BAUVA|nr:hypothetical protein L6164_012801 [Bauhinia variegata]
MSQILLINLGCMESFLSVPNNVGKLNKRWHSAFFTICCSRAILSHFKDNVAIGKRAKVRPCSSFSIVDLNPYQSFSIDQTSLTEITKEKNLERLQNFGGVDKVTSALETSVDYGILGDEKDIARRHDVFGSNTYHKPPSKGFFHFVLEAFKDPLIIILLICALLSLGLQIYREGLKHGWYDGGSIFIADLAVVIVCSVCHYLPNRQLLKLGKKIEVEVVRNGQQQQVSISEIVVGDVVCLRSGSQVPADGVLLEGHLLKADESSLTGEHQLVGVNKDLNPFLLSGSKVAFGHGRMLITSVGENTKWGEMMSLLGHESHKWRSSNIRLKGITRSMRLFGSLVAICTFIAMLGILVARYFTGHMKDGDGKLAFIMGKTRTSYIWTDLVGIIVSTVAVASSAIPEGLPLAMALTVAHAMKRMINNRTLLKTFSAYESLASATTICTDTRGILTVNRLMIRAFFGKDRMEEGSSHFVAGNVQQLLCQGIALITSQVPLEPSSEFSIEQAILSWATIELGMDAKGLQEGFSILNAETLTEDGKLIKTIIRKKDDHTIHMHLKGEAEVILATCSDYYGIEGTVKTIDNRTRRMLQYLIQVMANDGFKCIAFSHKVLEKEAHDDGQHQQQLENDSNELLCLMALKDPIGPGVRSAIKDCKQAGVNIKVITSDDIISAVAIASECDIVDPNEAMNNKQVVEASEFQSYTVAERIEKLDNICVIAKASYTDKLLVLQTLKQKGHVAAFIGNSTGDAPALEEADVGIHMGFQRNDTAVENSDIVVLNGGLMSVVEVLHMGRGFYDNFKVFTQFLFAANIASILTDFVSTVSSDQTPRTINIVAGVSTHEVPYAVLQILWLKLIIGTLAALALIGEQKTEKFTQEQPTRRDEPLISHIMWKNILIDASYEIIILLTLQFKGTSIFGVDNNVNDMMIFNLLVFFQVFAILKARKPEVNIFTGVQRRKLFWGIICGIVILQVVLVEILPQVTVTGALNGWQWGACIGIAFTSWPVGYIGNKHIPVPKKPFFPKL